MLTISGLSKAFDDRFVLRSVDLKLQAGETFGLIGRSGSGKSTLARCLVGLETADAGTVSLNGREIRPGHHDARRMVQYMWQDPLEGLSPYLTAQATVLETLNGFRIGGSRSRKNVALDLLDSLGVGADLAARRPHMLSGGQCQRVALARVLAAEPKVLILDEPFSALDLATQVSIIRLLEKVQQDRALSVIVISHDLAPLLRLCDRIGVLDDGGIAEDLSKADFLGRASHPLSRAYADLVLKPDEAGGEKQKPVR